MLVTDEEIATAQQALWSTLRVAAEPGGAAALAALLSRRFEARAGSRIAVVVSETEIPPGVDTPQDLEAVRKMLA